MATLTYNRLALPSIPPSAITSGLCLLSLVFIFSYVYFVAESVLHVVVRQDSESKEAVLMSEIATLETTVISAQHNISNRIAMQEGYKDEQPKIFVTKGGDSGLTLGNTAH